MALKDTLVQVRDDVAARRSDELPRRRLSFLLTRRQFFVSLTTELRVARGRGQGGAAHKLSELGRLTDEELAALVPVIAPSCTLEVHDGNICGRTPDSRLTGPVFAATPSAMDMIGRFDGHSPLGVVAKCHALENGESPADSFALARVVVLKLVLAGLCEPRWQ